MTSRSSAHNSPFDDIAATSSADGRSDTYSLKSVKSAEPNKARNFVSYKLQAEYERPWREDPRAKKSRKNNWIVYTFMILGVAGSAAICWNATRVVPKHDYCLILDDNFEEINPAVWNHEVQIDGFGSGAFDWTTTDSRNSYVDAEGLHIVPTLTNETTSFTNADLYNGATLNLTSAGGDGSCTSTALRSCAVASNSTLGHMIPPWRSARLNTQGKKTIKYGRVEVTAKLPKGDWLWPAIWMMPDTSEYGVWPRSGEIDIMESRGNAPGYPLGGRDIFASTWHWGPTTHTDAYWRTTEGHQLRRKDYSDVYQTFGFEWSEDYMFTYINNRRVQVIYTKFQPSTSMWQRGKFDGMQENNTLLINPWNVTSNPNAPFDQSFFLILNVAVGSRGGWFADNVANKPWVDGAENAQWTFYNAADEWLPTWGAGAERGMTIKNVKMWQQGACP